LFPVIHLGRFGFRKKHTPPGNNVSGISIEQVAIAEIAMKVYTEDYKQLDALNQMVAVLYYPNATGQGVSEKVLNDLQKKVARIPFSTRFTVLVAYRAMRATFPTLWKELFEGGNSPVNADDVELWNNLFSSLAKEGPKDIADNRRTEAYAVMNWLNKNAKDLKTARK
jgi:hypothetical protein